MKIPLTRGRKKIYWQYFDLQGYKINLILKVNCTDKMLDREEKAEILSWNNAYRACCVDIYFGSSLAVYAR